MRVSCIFYFFKYLFDNPDIVFDGFIRFKGLQVYLLSLLDLWITCSYFVALLLWLTSVLTFLPQELFNLLFVIVWDFIQIQRILLLLFLKQSMCIDIENGPRSETFQGVHLHGAIFVRSFVQNWIQLLLDAFNIGIILVAIVVVLSLFAVIIICIQSIVILLWDSIFCILTYISLASLSA